MGTLPGRQSTSGHRRAGPSLQE
ncbi:uncharacterized protein METZ01_LOCUS31318 [marine metagenome]|uniref:Uncharacterized protein n=1 Tax=marine metagenome TaxID=408172 RepID=A0A381QHW4_9ZZZZ